MLSLAWRNLWRQRRRSLITAAAVAFVVFISILYYSLGGASVNSMYQNLTEEVGHIQVHVEGYRDTRSFQEQLIDNAAEVREHIEVVTSQVEGGPAVAGVIDVPGLLAGEERSRAVGITGKRWPDVLREPFVEENLSGGRFVAPGDLTGIVLGRSLADALEVGLGDAVYVYAPGTEGFGAGAYTVTGLLDLADPAWEARAAYLSLEAAQELAAPDAVTRFEIHFPTFRRISDDEATRLAALRLANALGEGYSVETWRQLDPAFAGMLDLVGPLVYGVSVLFFLLAGLLVLNTVYLSLIERVREFGVIISLGAQGRKVMGMIVTESVLLCLTGALAGAAAGLAVVASWSGGLRIPGLGEYYATLGLNPVFYPSINPGQVLFAVAFAFITAVLAALWPAALAARLEPAEAMRHTA